MSNTPSDRDDLEARLDRLESTLEELRNAVVADDRLDADRPATTPAMETALRFTERLVVPATVAALEANVRALEFVQDRLRELERREPTAGRPARGDVSERMLDRLDDALVRMEQAITSADLPADAEARQLLERARNLNTEIRGRVRDPGRGPGPGPDPGPGPTGPEVVRIDVEEELDDIRDEVGTEEDPSEDDAPDEASDDSP